MIVDDHDWTRTMIGKFIARPGILIHECATGEEAVACAREFKPHWVSMDVNLPGINGFESARTICRENPDTRVLMVTATNEPAYRQLSKSVGAIGLILKENIVALRVMLDNELRQAGASSEPANPTYII
jgi:DNA-binding NarL/FixJ family response regulator